MSDKYPRLAAATRPRIRYCETTAKIPITRATVNQTVVSPVAKFDFFGSSLERFFLHVTGSPAVALPETSDRLNI